MTMRGRCLVYTLLLVVGVPLEAATLRGVVRADHRGGQPVPNVRLGAEGANPTVSDAYGKFTFKFPFKEPGDPVEVIPTTDYPVQNWGQMKQFLPKDADDHPLTILLCMEEMEEDCEKLRFQDNKRVISEKIENKYQQDRKEIERIHAAALAKLEEERDQYKTKYQQLLKETQRTNAAELAKLEEERDQDRAVADQLAEQLAQLKPEEASEIDQQAMRLFLEGKVAEALKTLGKRTGINYRSEPFLHRLAIHGDPNNSDLKASPFAQKRALASSSYTFGDPATPIARSYLGEPTKTRLIHGGSEVLHVHHVHGGVRWRRNPKSDPNNDIASGLNKVPKPDVLSTHLDSQTIGPGTSYNLEHECGAGGCQQAAGDFLYQGHSGHPYIGGMWGLWRVFDTRQPDLAKLPDMPDPPKAVDSTQLVGKTFDGKTVVAEADPNDPHQISLSTWVESQLPPQGKPLDGDDATVWDWSVEKRLYVGEKETQEKWPNYESDRPGERPVILFNPTNGRYAWPLFRPHLGQRPPFAPNGHSGAPWLGEDGYQDRPDGLCPDPQQWNIPDQTIRYYPISAVPVDIIRNEELRNIDTEGKIFVLNEDIRGETSDGNVLKVLLNKSKNIEPLVIRSHVGDCLRVIFTSKLPEDKKTGSKVNMHTHFVQFDPQASDGVITGFSFEQSVRPYRTEKRSDGDPEGVADEKHPRTLVAAVAPGAQEIVVNQVYRLTDAEGRARKVWIGVGLGEGMADASGYLPRTEIRRIEAITPNTSQGPFRIRLHRPLALAHQPGEAVGVEFVQYHWYSDVDTGTVFWHDHVDFKSWGHGLASAHVIEPAGSTWHDPKTGDPVRSGAIVDIHMPADASVGAGQKGSFREFVLFNIKEQFDRDRFGVRKATINLRAEPIDDPRSDIRRDGRKGSPAYWFSSVTHGDPATPIPRAYVGDPFVVRHLGVLDREGGIRITGHRFRLDRFAPSSAFSDSSPIGISGRYDLVLDGGAGGPLGRPGDFLYYDIIGRDMLGGAWGLIRVHDTSQAGLQPLPDRPPPPSGKGFPTQKPAKGDNFDQRPAEATESGDPCPAGARERIYEVHIRQTQILQQSRLKDLEDRVAGAALTIKDGMVYSLSGQPENYSIEPLVLRVNRDECLVVDLHNDLPPDRSDPGFNRASLHVGELLFDPQGSHGAAIGLNLDSTVAPGEKRIYRYFADQELGTTIAFNLANPTEAGIGAFAAVIVEPEGSEYRDIVSGKPIKTGVMADIVAPGQTFREIVTLFHDSDPFLGQDAMPYHWEAHCDPRGSSSGCSRDPERFGGMFTSISYKLNPWWLRNDQMAPSEVYSSQLYGDPGLVVKGAAGLPLMFRVAAPWAEQVHVFSLSGHRWSLEPAMNNSEQVFAHLLAPGSAFDVPVIGGFGGEYGKTGDFLFFDGRMPFTQAGLWGLIRVEPKEAP